jgi:hypothetical protein
MNLFPSPAFQPTIRVRSGRHARELRVAIEAMHKGGATTDEEVDRPDDPGAIVAALAALVAGGGYAMPGEIPSATVTPLGSQTRGEIVESHYLLGLSPCAPGVIRSLARMFEFLDACGSWSVLSLGISEAIPQSAQRADDRELDAPEAVQVPFSLDHHLAGDHEGDGAQVRIELDRPDDDDALEALRALFDAWGPVNAAGGFPGPGGLPYSGGGFVESVEPGLAHEVLVEIEHPFTTDASWAPLLRGMARIHADVCPIRAVEIG